MAQKLLACWSFIMLLSSERIGTELEGWNGGMMGGWEWQGNIPIFHFSEFFLIFSLDKPTSFFV